MFLLINLHKKRVEAFSFSASSPDGLIPQSSSAAFGDSILTHVAQLDQDLLPGEDDTIHAHHDAPKAAVGQV